MRTSKESMTVLGLTKKFSFRGKTYKWTCKLWQLFLFIAIMIGGSYSWILLMYVFTSK